MSKINPYEFIPFPEKIYYPEQELPNHHIYDAKLNTGYIKYAFKNESELIIGDGKSGEREEKIEEFFMINGLPVIPGSSMRGRIRVNAEILSCAYPRFVDEVLNEKHNTNPKAEIEKKFGKREKFDCIDLLFGFVESDFDKKDKGSYKGRLSFLDAKCCSAVDEKSFVRTRKVRLTTPKSSNDRYYKSSGRLKGAYKYYPEESHKNNEKIAISGKQNEKMMKELRLLRPKQKFGGKMFFNNLTDFELGLLLISLQYDKNLVDSIGMGKPLGYGKIMMMQVELYLDNENRFKDLEYSISNCSGKIDEFKKNFIQGMKENYDGNYEEVIEAYKKSKFRNNYQNNKRNPIQNKGNRSNNQPYNPADARQKLSGEGFNVSKNRR